MNGFSARFGGISRLIGKASLERLRHAHVAVIGVGGVGSWSVEALARSGVGQLTLVDFDEVCISNVNRQLPAINGTFGTAKVEVLAERIRAINPDCRVNAELTFLTASNAGTLLDRDYHAVIDAIDQPGVKALLIARCRERGIPVITAGAAGGRRDPTQVRVADLARATHDRLLQGVRKILRKEHNFPRDPKRAFGVDCVFSPEPVVYPTPEGDVCSRREAATDLKLDCRSGYGTATFVTGTFGFVAASRVINELAQS